MKKEFLILLVCFIAFLYSCKGDCPNVEVKEVKWVTYQKVYTKTRYFIPEYTINDINLNYYNKDNNTIVNVSITNNSKEYSLDFDVDSHYSYRTKKYGDLKNNYKHTTKQYEISPEETKEIIFTPNCVGDYQSIINMDFLDFKKVEQIKYDTITYDSLVVTKRMANTCRENTEAINKETNRVIKLYQQIGRIDPERMERDSIYNENKHIHKNVRSTKKVNQSIKPNRKK